MLFGPTRSCWVFISMSAQASRDRHSTCSLIPTVVSSSVHRDRRAVRRSANLEEVTPRREDVRHAVQPACDRRAGRTQLRLVRPICRWSMRTGARSPREEVIGWPHAVTCHHVGERVCRRDVVSRGGCVGRQYARYPRRGREIVDRRAYSARFMRWKGRRPGLGFSAATRSMRVSSASASPVSTCGSGRRAPGGGIMPSRSLRITFSPMTALSTTLAASNDASDNVPAFARSL